MFKLYQVVNKVREEVLPVNELYTVNELGEYEFYYNNYSKIDIDSVSIFIEDLEIERKNYIVTENSIYSKEANRFFQDYFGFASLNINNEVFKFNILIEKFNIVEIENILLFLWNCENKLFENFFSKSTINSKILNSGYNYEYTSKLLTFANSFYDFFQRLYPAFCNTPYSVLRNTISTIDYSPRDISEYSINWILGNIDSVIFDESYAGLPDSICIGNKYGILDRIDTEKSVESFSTYENKILLGAFIKMLSNLKHLKKIIDSSIDTYTYGYGNYVDFRDLKKTPFLKLFKDANSLEKQIEGLYNRYCNIFVGVEPKVEKPRVTNIFLQNSLYREAFRKIQETFNYKFVFDGELSLLNIKRLSTLYEFYNFHLIINFFKNKLNIDLFEVREQSNRQDNFIDRVSFKSDTISIDIYYNYHYPSILTNLVRIDKKRGTYYTPDYIINIRNEYVDTTIILDAKYSKLETVRSRYLPDCIFKYILNTGFKDEKYRKIDYLILLYSGETYELTVENNEFSPQVFIIPSKPRFEYFLEAQLNTIIEKEIPNSFYKKK